jgi:hypothetical protein
MSKFFPNSSQKEEEKVDKTENLSETTQELKGYLVQDQTPDPNEGKILISPEELNEKVKQMVAEQLSNIPSTPQPIIQEQPKIEYREVKKLDNSDDIPELVDFIPKNRRYEIINGTKTASHGIRTRSKKASALLYIHPVTKESHPLRLTENHPSFFEHLQFKEPGANRLRFVKMIDGVLFVPATDLQLQKFLHIHPDKGIVFREIDAEMDARKELDQYELKFKAQELVRNLDFPSQDALARFIVKGYSKDWTTSEIKRNLFAEVEKQSDHKHVIGLCENSNLLIQGTAKRAVDEGLLAFKDYRFVDEKGVLVMEVGRNRNEWEAIGEYLLSNEGDTLRRHLERVLY